VGHDLRGRHPILSHRRPPGPRHRVALHALMVVKREHPAPCVDGSPGLQSRQSLRISVREPRRLSRQGIQVGSLDPVIAIAATWSRRSESMMATTTFMRDLPKAQTEKSWRAPFKRNRDPGATRACRYPMAPTCYVRRPTRRLPACKPSGRPVPGFEAYWRSLATRRWARRFSFPSASDPTTARKSASASSSSPWSS